MTLDVAARREAAATGTQANRQDWTKEYGLAEFEEVIFNSLSFSSILEFK
jgi:hypothetical protein